MTESKATRHAGCEPIRRVAVVLAHCASLACLLLLSCGLQASAQVSDYGQKQMGPLADSHKPSVLEHVAIAQHLDTQLPLDAAFTDETGRAVHLGDYFNGTRPAVLALVYYKCPVLCSETLNGLVGALEMVHFNPGKDFDVVIASIDPSETPADAAKKKAALLRRYARLGTAGGWHFLTGKEPADHRARERDRLWLRPDLWPRRPHEPVCPRQRNPARYPRMAASRSTTWASSFHPMTCVLAWSKHRRATSARRLKIYLPTAIAMTPPTPCTRLSSCASCRRPALRPCFSWAVTC